MFKICSRNLAKKLMDVLCFVQEALETIMQSSYAAWKPPTLPILIGISGIPISRDAPIVLG